jgi:hypothetical protein
VGGAHQISKKCADGGLLGSRACIALKHHPFVRGQLPSHRRQDRVGLRVSGNKQPGPDRKIRGEVAVLAHSEVADNDEGGANNGMQARGAGDLCDEDTSEGLC